MLRASTESDATALTAFLMGAAACGLLRTDGLSGQPTPVDWFDDPAI